MQGTRMSTVARAAAAASSALLLGLLVAPTASATGRTEMNLQDKCEKASFDIFVGPGVCVGNGNVDFLTFAGQLNPADGGHDAWRFSREDTHIDVGQPMLIRNVGGEFHTFTEVDNFGVSPFAPDPRLNNVFPQGTAVAMTTDRSLDTPIEVFNSTGVPQGASTTLGFTEPGTHKFQCMIHPWMQITVEVR